jgi:hypothetical protein
MPLRQTGGGGRGPFLTLTLYEGERSASQSEHKQDMAQITQSRRILENKTKTLLEVTIKYNM